MSELVDRAIKATFWSALDVFLRQGLQFVVSVALARLVAPAEFGVLALLSLFIGVAGVFVDSGFSSALIQRQSTSHADESTVFWFNLALGASMTFALAAAAPAIAAFFDQPVLVPLMRLVAPNILIGALGSIHGTLLTRDLQFRTQMKIGVVSTVVSGTVAIALAWRGYGVWALAWQMLASSICTSTLLWRLHRWRPGFVFSLASARRLFGFGGYLLAAALLDTVYTRLYTVLVGKLFGVRELGFFNRADNLRQLPTNVLSSVLTRVALPVFSTAGTDRLRLRRGVRMSVRGMMLFNAPTMLGLAAVAHPLTVTLLGARWEPAAPILQVLCLAGVPWPLHVINLNALMAQGHSHLFFRLEVAKKVLGATLLLAGAAMGIMAMAWSMVAFSVLAFFVNAWYSGRFLDYGPLAQIRDTLPIILLSIVMYLVTRELGQWWQPTSSLTLIVQVLAGVTFMAVSASLLRLSALREAIGLLRRRGRPESGGE